MGSLAFWIAWLSLPPVISSGLCRILDYTPQKQSLGASIPRNDVGVRIGSAGTSPRETERDGEQASMERGVSKVERWKGTRGDGRGAEQCTALGGGGRNQLKG